MGSRDSPKLVKGYFRQTSFVQKVFSHRNNVVSNNSYHLLNSSVLATVLSDEHIQTHAHLMLTILCGRYYFSLPVINEETEAQRQ